MGQFDLNLSTRPLPAYRVTSLLLTIALVALIAISVWQAVGFLRYSSMANEIRGDEQNIRVESEVAAEQMADLRQILDRPESAAKLSEIEFLNNLIARKSFSWTRIFANLEELVPPDVHLTSLRPEAFEDGSINLRIELKGRSIADVSGLIEAMERSAAFEDVQVSVEEKIATAPAAAASDVQIQLSVRYFPEREMP